MSDFSVTMMGPTSSGWAKKSTPQLLELEPATLADVAARKALQSQEPRDLEPGKYTVILEPAAVLDLLGFLMMDFGGLSVKEQRSCFTGRVGKRLFGENINIRDDVFHPLQAGAPFDGEGMPRHRVSLVEKGVVKSLVYSRRTARSWALSLPDMDFPCPTNSAKCLSTLWWTEIGTPWMRSSVQPSEAC